LSPSPLRPFVFVAVFVAVSMRSYMCMSVFFCFVCLLEYNPKNYTPPPVGKEVIPLGVITHGQRHKPREYQRQWYKPFTCQSMINTHFTMFQSDGVKGCAIIEYPQFISSMSDLACLHANFYQKNRAEPAQLDIFSFQNLSSASSSPFFFLLSG